MGLRLSTLLGLTVLLCTINSYVASGEIWRKSAVQDQPCSLPAFSRVDQTDNVPWIGENVHDLICRGCGNLQCEWSTHPTYGIIPNNIGDIINQRIANGSNSGSEFTVINSITWYYTWSFDVGTNSLTSNIWITE